jgi:hypothetical protein
MILLLAAGMLLASATAPARAAGDLPIRDLLPAPACAEGWNMDGEVAVFDRDTLFDRIDGEAESYFPYGFDRLASARYADPGNPKVAVEADVYRMGSPLDAFGIYANYRRRESAGAPIGDDGTLSPSQLIFRQGRYFVRLQASGTAKLEGTLFLECARAISRRLPQGTGRPEELEVLSIPAVVPKSERYVARSLLGYDFLRRGLVADAVLDGDPMQLLLVPEDSAEAASRALEAYRSYLKASGKGLPAEEDPGRTSLSAVDPLFGNVRMTRSGRFLVGAVRFRNPSAAKRLVDQLRSRVEGGKD